MDSTILALTEPIMVEMPTEGSPQTVDESGNIVRQPPKRFCILKFGKIPYTKGDKDDEFVFSPESAKRIVEEFKKRGKDLVVDWDHSTLDNDSPHAGNAPAAGWIQDLEITPEGLYALVKNWTPKGAERLTNGEYRYMSPVIQFDKSKAPTSLHSIGLTNHPAIHNLEALVAANDKGSAMKEKYQATIKQLKAGKEKMEEMLVKTVQSYSDHVAGDEGNESEMAAFMDELLKTESFADDASVNAVLQEIAQYKATNQIPPVDQVSQANQPVVVGYLGWVAGKKDAVSDVALQRLYQAEHDVYANKIQGLESVKPAAPYQPPPIAAPVVPPTQTTPAQPIQMNDTEKFTDDGVKAFLRLHDCASLEDVTKKFMDIDSKNASQIKALNDQLATFKAEDLVRKALEDGKITEAMRPVAIEMAKKDAGGFSAWTDACPKVVGSFNDQTQSESKDTASLIARTNIQNSVAKAMGVDADSVFK